LVVNFGCTPESYVSTFLGWVGGVATTAVGAWVSGRFHSYEQERKEHREDLKDKVLVPLRAGLERYASPLLTGQVSLLSIEHAATDFDASASVTEEPAKYGPVLVAKFPSAAIFGPLDSALLHDARTNHFRGLFGKFDEIYNSWMKHNADCHAWAAQLARKILQGSGMPAFPDPPDSPGSYVMHHGLAVFLYQRLFQFQTFAVRKQEERERWILTGAQYTLAVGTEEQVDALIAHLNRLQESESEPALRLRETAGTLHSRYTGFMEELAYSINDRRLEGRCGLVRFFVFLS
jgi:hypothetical protein